jgi:hypothetical protein
MMLFTLRDVTKEKEKRRLRKAAAQFAKVV